MHRDIKGSIVGLLILILILFFTSGIGAVWRFLCNLAIATWVILCIFNQVTVGIVGDSVLVLVFKSSITFLIVGIILEAINAPRDDVGHYLGKGLFWLVGMPISFILNFIASLIF